MIGACDIFVVVTGGKDYLAKGYEFPDAHIIEIASGSDRHLGSGNQDKRQRAMAQLEQGYAEAMQILKPICKLGEVQARIATTLQRLYNAEAHFESGNESAASEREFLKRQIDGAIK